MKLFYALKSSYAFGLGFLLLISQSVWAEGNLAAAETKKSMCVGCHGIAGYQSSFPEVYSVPYIGGQSAEYLKAALAAYKKGDRKHPTMNAIAQSLSEQDIADLATYYSQVN